MRYKHYKGGVYEFVDVATHSESLETLIIYRDAVSGALWARPEEMFHGRLPDGRKRFQALTEPADDG